MPLEREVEAQGTDRVLLAVLAAGFALRLALILAGLGQPPARWEYDEIAARWLAGDGYTYEHLAGVTYHAYYSGVPYVALLALSRSLTASDLPVQLVHAGLALVSAACAARLARGLVPADPRRAGHVTAALTLAAPGLLYYDVARVHPLALDVALTLAALVALRHAWRTSRARAALGAGLLLGLALLQHGSLLAFVLLVPILALARGRSRQAAALAVGLVLAVGPWLARNVHVVGAPLIVTTTAEHFWIGNAAGSTGGALFPDGTPVIASLPPRAASAIAAGDERGQQRVFQSLGFDLVRARPLAFAAGVLVKLGRFWTLAPHVGQLYPRWWTWAASAWFALLALGALYGVARAWSLPTARPTIVLVLAVCACVSLTHALFYFELRHRFLLEPLLAVLAAAASRGGVPRFPGGGAEGQAGRKEV